MSDQLADSAERLFAANTGKAVIRAAEEGAFPPALWDAVIGAGFTAALLPEHAGGYGLRSPRRWRWCVSRPATPRRSRSPRPCSLAGCSPRPDCRCQKGC